MKTNSLLILILLSIILLFCKEETLVENDSGLDKFSGKIYAIIDSQKVNIENVKVLLRDDSTFTDKEGIFTFKEVPRGEYQITFLFSSSSHPFIKDKTLSVTSNQSNNIEEFLVYQKAVFEGKVYTEIGNERTNIENAKVYFLGDSTTTDSKGNFIFNYEYSEYAGTTQPMMIRYTEGYFDRYLTIALISDKLYDEFIILPKVNLTVELFRIHESERIFLNDVNVKLNGEPIDNISEGNYYKSNLHIGTYQLSINYPGFYPITDSIELNSIENDFSYEMTNILDEDIIYVQNNNYYYRDRYGELTQISYTNESISSEVEFFSDNKSFVYVSSQGSSYKINKIDLTTLQHEVLYESDKALRSLRISPNEDKIYFIKSLSEYWEGSIAYLELSSNQVVEVDPGPYYQAQLFHDCQKIAYTEKYELISGFWRSYLIIRNFSNNDSTLVYFVDRPLEVRDIARNDELLFIVTHFDEGQFGHFYNTVSRENIFPEEYIFGYNMGVFTDDGKNIFGIEANCCDNEGHYPVLFIDVNTFQKTIIDYSKIRIGFNTLSYSDKSNKYLYSLNGDVKVYDLNTGKSYNFIATEANEFAARFVNVR